MSDVDITMPQLGETVAEGTVSRWLVVEGEAVEADAPVLEVSTDKVDTEVVAPVSGSLRSIVVTEGETVDVGTVLATIAPDSGPDLPERDPDQTEEGPSASQRTEVPDTPVAPVDHPAHPARTARTTAPPAPARGPRRPDSGHRHTHSPRVRRLAHEHGVRLEDLQGTGVGGRVTPDDVTAASSRPEPAAPAAAPGAPGAPVPTRAPTRVPRDDARVEPLSRRRRVIAERMHRSLLESAQLTTVVEVDLTRVVEERQRVRASFQERYGVSISVLAFVAEAAVAALADHPVIHAELDLEAGTVAYPRSVDLGVAVDTEEGLVVPVVRSADELSTGGLARRIAELAARAREGSATADDYAGGSFTITNTGSRGALFDTPILNAPQAAILGLGATVRRPVALRGDDGEEVIAVRSMAYLSLTYDHRLVDGADAARYLQTVKELLETSAVATAGTTPR